MFARRGIPNPKINTPFTAQKTASTEAAAFSPAKSCAFADQNKCRLDEEVNPFRSSVGSVRRDICSNNAFYFILPYLPLPFWPFCIYLQHFGSRSALFCLLQHSILPLRGDTAFTAAASGTRARRRQHGAPLASSVRVVTSRL